MWRACASRFWNKQRQKSSVLPTRVVVGSMLPLELQALHLSGGGAESAGIPPNSEQQCLVLRHSSDRVPHQDHQHQRWIRNIRKRLFSRGGIVSHQKSRCDHGQPRETSWHDTKQETIERRQLRAVSSRAEIIKENESSEVHVQS